MSNVIDIAEAEDFLKQQQLLNDLVNLLHHRLLVTESALEYLYGRGITMEQIERYKIGCMREGDVCTILPKLPGKPYNNFFSGFVTFPLAQKETIVTVVGRYIGSKYKRLMENPYRFLTRPIYNMINESVINNYPEVILTEGFIDYLTLERFYPNTVGILAIAQFRKSWAKKLKDKDVVYIAFDNDSNKAGDKNAQRVAELLLKHGQDDVRRVVLPREESEKCCDVNSFFLAQRGEFKKQFDHLLKNAKKMKALPKKEVSEDSSHMSEDFLRLTGARLVELIGQVANLRLSTNKFTCKCIFDPSYAPLADPTKEHIDERESMFIFGENAPKGEGITCFGCSVGMEGNHKKIVDRVKEILKYKGSN